MSDRWGNDPTQPSPGSQGGGAYPGAGADQTQAMPSGGQGPQSGRAAADAQARRRRRLIWAWVLGGLAVIIIVVLLVLLLTSGSSSSDVSIDSFTVPATVPCSGPTTIGVSWTATNAKQVLLTVDGVAVKTYPGNSAADSVPFICNGAPHTYAIQATGTNNSVATKTQTVTAVVTSTTTRGTTPTTSAPTTTKPTTTSSTTTSTTTTTTSP